MSIIALYAPGATDFSTLGLGALTPSACTVTWRAAGEYELTLEQPIDDTLRWAQIANGCVISAPVPVRESPLYEYGVSAGGSVTRNIWRVARTTVGLYMRTGYGTGYPALRYYKNGVEVIELDRQTVNGRVWIHCTTVVGGETGYMSTKWLDLVRTETESVSGGRPADQSVIQMTQSRFQLFRVYSVEQDTEAGVVTAKARHVFYDLAGNMLNGEYKPEGVGGAAAVAEVFSKLKNPHGFTAYARALTRGTVTADYSYQNPVNILLDPDEGIVHQCGCQIILDNFDIHLIDDIPSDMGVTIRRGKNLIGVTATTDGANVVTQIKPCGKDVDGNDWWLADAEGPERYVNSPYIDSYPTVRTVKRDYDVKLVKKDEDNETSFRDSSAGRAAAREKLRSLAQAEFDAGADMPTYGMDVDFVLLQDAEGYEQYAGLQAVHPYDTVTVADSLIGVTAKVRVTGCEWDCLAEQYESVTLGELQDLQTTVYSYNLPTGGVSGSKIAPGSASGNILRDATIQYAKISVAAIEQLSAQSITALTAHLQEVIAGSVTADELYAALATINKAVIGSAEIDWAKIDRLTAVVAELSQAEIGTADIDWAHIKDLATDTAIITEGVGGQLMISRLAVTEANMVSLTTGELVVKGEDGGFYAVSVDAEGKIVTTRKQVANGDVQNLSINAGEKLIEGTVTAACLNATDIFADSAIIRQLIAANLDVDALFAREAFINLLRTSKIVGDKSITMIAGAAEDALSAAQGGVTGTDVEFYLSTSATALSGGAWQTAAPPWTDGKYMWMRVKTTLKSGEVTTSTPTCISGAQGPKGADGAAGVSVSSVTNYYLATASSSGVTTSTSGWTIGVQSVTATKKYLWNYEQTNYSDGSSVKTTPCIIGVYGDTGPQGASGVGITSIEEHYARSSSNSAVPTSWSDTVPTLTATYKYLWNYETVRYTDGNMTETAKRVIGVYGDTGAAGVSVAAMTEEYYLSTSKTAVTGGSWQTAQPEWSLGKYVWTRVKIDYSDGSSSYTEPYCDSSWELVNENSIHSGAEPPAAPIPAGKIWIDSGVNPTVIRRWLGLDVPTDREYDAGGGTLTPGTLGAYFTMTNGSGTSGWTVSAGSGGGLKLVPGNIGVNSSTATIILTATRALSGVVIRGAYTTETNYDKLTLAVAGSYVLDDVSGTSADAQRFSGSLAQGQTIMLSYAKDSSQSAAGEANTAFTITCSTAVPSGFKSSGWEIVSDTAEIRAVMDAAAADAAAAKTAASNAQETAGNAQAAASSAQTTADNAVTRSEFQRVVRIDAEGLHVGDNQSNGEVLVDSGSVNVVFNGRKYSKFSGNYVQFGNYQLRQSSDGGLVFKLA